MTLLPVRRNTNPVGKLLAMGIVFLYLLLVCNVGQARLEAQEQESETTAASREYQIKAAYLYQFGRYIQWPDSAFANAEAPFVIGVLENDPIALDLDQIVQTKKIGDRGIDIRKFSPTSNFEGCQTLFFSSAVSPEVQTEIIRRLSGRNILLVGETDEFIKSGGVIKFVIEDYKIRLLIDRKAAERQGLRVSSKLLQIAHVVD
jgi:hypothetical protein